MKKVNLTSKDELRELLEKKVSQEGIQLIKELFTSLSSIICILNRRNEIVFANDKLLEKYDIDLQKDILGLRFGDVVNCVNLTGDDSVCGMSDKCRYCGANYTFSDFWKKGEEEVVNECRLIRKKNGHTEQHDLEITASPFNYGDHYMVVSLTDITEKKRREMLERIFFHDIINMAGSLNGILNLLIDYPDRDSDELLGIASSLSSQIIEEIKAQQQLVKAEKGELEITSDQISMESFLTELRNKVQFCQEAFERHILIEDRSNNKTFVSDNVLLTRVVFNMAKNALEAVDRGEEILIEGFCTETTIRISVHNKTYIEEDVRNQLFQRSYSTKGKNRGVGTYSMKLLGERYLKGKVDFTSDKKSGTTFYIEIPLVE